ncbi:MAG: hypothetical protein ACFE95_02295 [Candidatus Hodarchaeota archaeon]
MKRVLEERQGKSIKHLLLFIIFLVFFLSLTLNFVPSTAEPLETSTSILANSGVVKSGETIQFTVWTYTGFDPVTTGPLRITDTNTSEYIESTILGGKAVINWTVPNPFVEGIHIFEAEYQGFPGYSASSGICHMRFDDFTPGSSRPTSITLISNSTVVFKNSSIKFTVELSIHYKWWFLGGYIKVKNTDLSGSPTIHTYGPLPSYYPGTDPAILIYSFDYQLPVFSSIGVNQFIANYTGSSESQTSPCVSEPHNVTVMSTGFWLIQNTDQDELQREDDTLELNTTVLGDYPIGLKLESYCFLGLEKVLIDTQILTGRTTTSYFTPNSSFTLGNLSIISELIDPSTKYQYANSTKNVKIHDRARIIHTENASEFKHNETIHFDVYVTEEDVWTRPVICQVELVDITDGNKSINNKTTNQDGFVAFDYFISQNATVGSHGYAFVTSDSGDYIIDIEHRFSITIKGLTQIDLTFESGGVNRNSFTNITVTVLSGDDDLDEGFVSLEFAINQSVIMSQNCTPGLILSYFIKPSHPIGITIYQVHFFGSNNYEDHIEQFNLPVFSNPTFNTTNMGQNATEVVKGQTIRIWGQLIDEIGNPIYNESIRIEDLSNGLYLGTCQTNDHGIFYYDYYISEALQIGLHFIEISYEGNFFKFYRSSENSPLFVFTVRPPLNIMIPSKVYANNFTIISLEGGLNEQIELEWKDNQNDSDWIPITSVKLDSQGQGSYNWPTPYYRGSFSVRVIGTNGTMKYAISEMYVIPKINFFDTGIGNVNDPYYFTVYCSEQYELWTSGQKINSSISGNYTYQYTFTSRGIKEIIIISSGSYIQFRRAFFNITVVEDLSISISVPSESIINKPVIIDGTVLGEVSGPISEIDTQLIVDGIIVEFDSTNTAGVFYFPWIFTESGYHQVSVSISIHENESLFYNVAISDESIIYVHPITDTQANNTDPASQTQPENNNSLSKVVVKEEVNDLIELGFAGSIFAGLVAVGNIINRKRRI